MRPVGDGVFDASRPHVGSRWQKLTRTEPYPPGAFLVSLPLSSYGLKISEALTRVSLTKRSCVTWMGLGGTTLIGAVTCLLLALQWWGQTRPLSSGRVTGLLIGCRCPVFLVRVLVVESRRTCNNSIAYPPLGMCSHGKHFTAGSFGQDFSPPVGRLKKRSI